jgi:hypothetical protein
MWKTSKMTVISVETLSVDWFVDWFVEWFVEWFDGERLRVE